MEEWPNCTGPSPNQDFWVPRDFRFHYPTRLNTCLGLGSRRTGSFWVAYLHTFTDRIGSLTKPSSNHLLTLRNITKCALLCLRIFAVFFIGIRNSTCAIKAPCGVTWAKTRGLLGSLITKDWSFRFLKVHSLARLWRIQSRTCEDKGHIKGVPLPTADVEYGAT